MATLTKASNELFRRSPDERYTNTADLDAAARNDRQHGRVAVLPMKRLQTYAEGDEVRITGGGDGARMTAAAWQQLCTKVNAPADYLSTLSPNTAATNLNEGLQKLEDKKALVLVDDRNEVNLIRAFTSKKYSRIWNADITSRLIRLEQETSFQPAPASFDGSRGLYLGDRDMFAFLVDNNRRIFEKAPGGGLSRGFMAWNSETGHRKIGFMKFLYEYVCGNHMIWGAQDMMHLSLRHIGDVEDRIPTADELIGVLTEFANTSSEADEVRIKRASEAKLGDDKEEVLDRIFGLRVPILGKKFCSDAYDLAVEHDSWYGDPNTIWGFSNGVTELARDKANADSRFALELAASKILDLVKE